MLTLDGASLHYLSQSHLSLLSLLSPPNVLQPLIPSSDLLKANVVDRDHVFVPSGWDSWGKIRVLRDGFDVEGVSAGWSADLSSVLGDKNFDQGALEVYEDTVSDPKRVVTLFLNWSKIVNFGCHRCIRREGFCCNGRAGTDVSTTTVHDHGGENGKRTTRDAATKYPNPTTDEPRSECWN